VTPRLRRTDQAYAKTLIARPGMRGNAMNDNRVRETPTQQAVRQIVGPAAVWMVNQLLNRPRARRARRAIDDAALLKAQRAASEIVRRSKNSMRNPGYLAAGLASMALGIGLIARSTRK
jgi:hypothetical protein